MTYARQEGDYNIVYRETLDYAFKHGEPELFRMSRRCDYDCCSRLMDMMGRWSSETEEQRLDGQMKIIEEFGLERCLYISAATVRGNSRLEFPDEMKEWANTVRISDDRFVNATNVLLAKSDPLFDFIGTVRRLEKENWKPGEKAATSESIENAEEAENPAKSSATWKYARVPSAALVEKQERRTLFSMPEGEYSGCGFWIPSKLVKEDKGGYRLSIPSDFEANVIKRVDGRWDYRRAKTLTASELFSAINGKGKECYKAAESKPAKGDDGKGGM